MQPRHQPRAILPANMRTQDFEGQRLAEMLTTVLLGAAGVRSTHPYTHAPRHISPHMHAPRHTSPSTCTLASSPHLSRSSPSWLASPSKTSSSPSTLVSPAPHSPSSSSSHRGHSTTRTPRTGCRRTTCLHRVTASMWMGRRLDRGDMSEGGEVCNIQCAVYSVQCSIQYAMQYTVCNAVYSVQCSIQCAMQYTTQHTDQRNIITAIHGSFDQTFTGDAMAALLFS
jgi:hypothetical protein